jgi:hypothetical protein
MKSTLRSRGSSDISDLATLGRHSLAAGLQFISSVIGVAVSSSREWICGGGPPPGGTDVSIAKYAPADSSPVTRNV